MDLLLPIFVYLKLHNNIKNSIIAALEALDGVGG